ncbi:MAG: GAF domain-containing protein [Anaerolineales bacterium]
MTTLRSGSLWERIQAQWERLVGVDLPDEDLARRGRLFNIVMVLNVLTTASIALLFLAVRYLFGFEDFPAGAAVPFPFIFIPLAAWWIWLSKQGRVQLAAQFYVWFNLIMSALAASIFDGYQSPAFAGFTWTVVVAGTLISPSYALLMGGLIVGFFGLLFTLQTSGLFTPFMSSGDAIVVVFPFYNIIVLAFATGMLTYINMRSLRDALSRARRAGRDLEIERFTLEERVEAGVRDANRRAKQFEMIVDLLRRFGTFRDLSALLPESVQLIAEQLGVEHAALFLIDDRARYLILEAASSESGQQLLAEGREVVLGGEGLVGAAGATGRSLHARFDEEPTYFANSDLPGARVEVALPLTARGQILGVLDLQSRDFDLLSEDDLAMLRILAEGLAASLENARLLAETQRALERLERYHEEDAIESWRKALSRRGMQLAYDYDRVSLQSVTVEDPHPLWAEIQELQVHQQDGRYLLLAPVRVRDRTLGVLTFEASRPWTADEQQLAETVVNQLGLALENARLLEDTRRSALQERARSEIVSRVRSSVHMDAILRSAAQEIGRALKVERARIQLLPGASTAKELE